MLEYPHWHDACKWGFGANVGMEFGFRGNDVEYAVLPAMHRYSGKFNFWIDHARELIGDIKFDQVWLEVVHSHIEDDVLDFITSLAPVRLGFVFESLELLPEEWANNPNACKIREEIIQKRLPMLTHMVNTDETDAARLNSQNGLQARPIPPGFVVPREFICQHPPPPRLDFGLFFGTLYGERKQWVENPKLASVLRYSNQSPELNTPYPAAWDDLHRQVQVIFEHGAYQAEMLDSYLDAVRTIRIESFKFWLEGLRLGAAVVNLPQWGRAYASRIIEGMAAGRPVISRAMENRPYAASVFEDGKEILLYRSEDELIEQINKVLKDPEFARQIATNARRKIEQTHTAEGYVAELLRWTQG